MVQSCNDEDHLWIERLVSLAMRGFSNSMDQGSPKISEISGQQVECRGLISTFVV
jgi:hypothetical protein